MRRAETIVSRDQLAEHVWGGDYDPFSNLADVYVGYLRRKLTAAGIAGTLIQTIRGLGYMLKQTAAESPHAHPILPGSPHLRWTAAFGCILVLTCVGIYSGTEGLSLQRPRRAVADACRDRTGVGSGRPVRCALPRIPRGAGRGHVCGKVRAAVRQPRPVDQSVDSPQEWSGAGADGRAARRTRRPCSDPFVVADGRPARMVALAARKDGQAYVVAVGLFSQPVLTTLSRLAWLLVASRSQVSPPPLSPGTCSPRARWPRRPRHRTCRTHCPGRLLRAARIPLLSTTKWGG